jgi:hypothetical protein
MHASVGAYIGLFEIFGGGGPVSTPNEANTARKALLLPWGFFIIVTLATYTANLAAVLSRQTLDIPFRNIQECVDGRCNFCSSYHAIN